MFGGDGPYVASYLYPQTQATLVPFFCFLIFDLRECLSRYPRLFDGHSCRVCRSAKARPITGLRQTSKSSCDVVFRSLQIECMSILSQSVISQLRERATTRGDNKNKLAHFCLLGQAISPYSIFHISCIDIVGLVDLENTISASHASMYEGIVRAWKSNCRPTFVARSFGLTRLPSPHVLSPLSPKSCQTSRLFRSLWGWTGSFLCFW